MPPGCRCVAAFWRNARAIPGPASDILPTRHSTYQQDQCELHSELDVVAGKPQFNGVPAATTADPIRSAGMACYGGRLRRDHVQDAILDTDQPVCLWQRLFLIVHRD